MAVKQFDDFMQDLPDYKEVLPEVVLERLNEYYEEYVVRQIAAENENKSFSARNLRNYSSSLGTNALLAERSEQRVQAACNIVINNYKEQTGKKVANM